MTERITDKDIEWLEHMNNDYPRDLTHTLTLMIEKLAKAVKEIQDEL